MDYDLGKCEWCGKLTVKTMMGKPRKYCSRSCENRAYRNRKQKNRVSGLSDLNNSLTIPSAKDTESISLRQAEDEDLGLLVRFIYRPEWIWNAGKFPNWREDPRSHRLKILIYRMQKGKDAVTGARLGPSWDLHHLVSPKICPKLCFCPWNVIAVNPENHKKIHQVRRQRQLLLLSPNQIEN